MFGTITIGADPEAFVRTIATKEVISAEGMIGGTKDEPLSISEEGHAIQEDNIMVEFNIPPSECQQSFTDNINYCKDYLNTLLAFDNCELAILPSSEIDSKFLQTEQAKMFGCDPDINVYLKGYNKKPCSTGTLRTCGGHIHIGMSNAHKVKFEYKEQLVMAMDAVLGLESLSLDSDDRRRELYGNAGSFRIKSYGIEYRTLSNFWIENDELMGWAYNKTLEAIELVESGVIVDIIDKYKSQIEECINNNNKKKSLKLLNKIKKITKTKIYK